MNHTEQRKTNDGQGLGWQSLIIFIYYINSWVRKLKNQTFQSKLCAFEFSTQSKLDWKYHLH